MSYELRVPLHAVIGFADLFKAEHSLEDEPVFANEIKKNTDVLLNLINDILFISRLDAHMIEYNYEVHDFATLFEGWCNHGLEMAGHNARKIINIEDSLNPCFFHLLEFAYSAWLVAPSFICKVSNGGWVLLMLYHPLLSHF